MKTHLRGVSTRIVVTGSKLEVRPLTDDEVIRLLQLHNVDQNVHNSILIAAYSGRLRNLRIG